MDAVRFILTGVALIIVLTTAAELFLKLIDAVGWLWKNAR